MNMAKKLILNPAIVFIFLIAIACIAYSGLSDQKTAMEDIFNNRFKVYQDTTNIIKNIGNVHSSIYKVMSWSTMNYDAQKIAALVNEQKASLAKTVDLVKTIVKSNALTPDERKIFEKTLNDLTEYQKPAEGAMAIGASDLTTATMFMNTSDEKYQVLNQTLNDLMVLENKLSKEKYDSSMGSFNAVMRTFIVLMVIAVILSIGTNIFLAKMITLPIGHTIEVIKKVAEGDLTQEINMESKDEIGELAMSFNTMRLKMGDAVGQSLSIAKMLSDSSNNQAASLEETTASLDEMASMTRQNASNTGEANNLMTAAKLSIEKANASMSDLTKSMKEIAVASEQTQKII